MTLRANGSYIGFSRAPTTAQGSASGVWDLEQAAYQRRIGQWPPIDFDPDFANVSLLLNMDGTNGSTTFADSSSNARTVTAFGDAEVSTAQAKFGQSAAFDGTGDYLSSANYAGFDLGDGDFTIECQVYKTSALTTTSAIIALEGGGGSRWSFYWRGASSSFSIYHVSTLLIGSVSLSLNTWYHIAWVRDNGELKTFVNGTLDNTATPSTASIGGYDLYIGQSGLGTEYWPGYIDEVRITKGVARYTANFTPPAAPFLNV